MKLKYFIFFILASLLLSSCKKKLRISKSLNCNSSIINNLDIVNCLKNLFSIKIPKDWKTNLYQDEVQSSIFSADTTKQLTETVLLDVTFVQKKINFNEAFLLKQEQQYLSENLVKTKLNEFIFLDKPTLSMLFKGKKGKFNYQIWNTFLKVNDSNFIIAKIEVYGDSLVNQRVCKAFSLIENIKLHQE